MADGKWVEGISSAMTVAEVGRIVLPLRFEVVLQYLAPAVEHPEKDIESVHQLRVGTRRAGAAVRIFSPCLPKKRLREIKSCLRAIRRASGGARDWDVFIQSLAKAQPLAIASGKPALNFLLGYALGFRQSAQVELIVAATEFGHRFRIQCNEVAGSLHELEGASGPTPFGLLATDQLNKLLAVFQAAVSKAPSEAGDLHRLRIQAKRLRYAIELFASCFAPKLREELLPEIVAVQEILGCVQDSAVMLTNLTQLRRQVMAAIPSEWPMLKPGIDGLLRANRSKLTAARKKYAAWLGNWDKVVEILSQTALVSLH